MGERLRVGQVVCRPEGVKPERGIVVFAQGEGFDGHKRMYAEDYVIQTSYLTSVIGNADDDWIQVPRSEWTATEAATATMASHINPDWWDDADGEPPEYLLVDYAMLLSLLPEEERDWIERNDRPSLIDLILQVAGELDRARGIDPDATARGWESLIHMAELAAYG